MTLRESTGGQRMPITLVLADDHSIFLNGLAEELCREPEFRVLVRCLDGKAAIEAVREKKPDILILDVRMPEMDGLEVLQEMRKEKLSTRVVLLAAELDDDQMIEAIRLGVRGILLKEMPTRLFTQCIHKVHAGEQWIETRSAGRLLERSLKGESAMDDMSEILTPREIKIVRMVADDLRNKEIAARLDISEATVKNHLYNIYQKLKVDNRAALVQYARDKGLV